MSFLALVALVSVAWLFWAVGGALGLSADIAEGMRPHDAGFSLMPVIPVFPLMAIGLAMGIDGFAPPMGHVGDRRLSRVVGHAVYWQYPSRRASTSEGTS
jgi:hypothetical protein